MCLQAASVEGNILAGHHQALRACGTKMTICSALHSPYELRYLHEVAFLLSLLTWRFPKALSGTTYWPGLAVVVT